MAPRWRRWSSGSALAAAVLASLAPGVASVRLQPWGDARVEAPAAEFLQSRLSADLARRVLDVAPFRYRIATWLRGGATVAIAGGPELRPPADYMLSGVVFLRDGLVTWGIRRGGTVATAWDMDSGEALRELRLPAQIVAVRPLPNGEGAVLCDAGAGCAIWGAGGAVVELPHIGLQFYSSGVEVFPSGRLLQWGSGWLREARLGHEAETHGGFGPLVRDATTGEVLCAPGSQRYPVNFARIFPDGRRMLTGDSSDGVLVVIWNATSCALLQKLVHSQPVMQVSVLDGGASVGTVTWAREVTIWDAGSGERSRTRVLPAPSGVWQDAAFLGPDRLVVVSGRQLVLCNVTSGELLHQWEQPRIDDIVVTPGGDTLVACASGGATVAIWDTGSPARPRALISDTGRSGNGECRVAVGLGSILDPRGYGRGLTWNELPSSWRPRLP